jgi:hypothetical protein
VSPATPFGGPLDALADEVVLAATLAPAAALAAPDRVSLFPPC